MTTITTMSASPWAKEWKSLASDDSQKAFLLATFYKAFGIWPADIPQEAIQKLVAGRNPDDILQSRRLRTPRLQDDLAPATLRASLGAMTGDSITVDDGDDIPPPASGTAQKRKRVDNTDVNAVLLASNQALAAALQQLAAREPNRDRAAQASSEEELTTLSGENEILRTSVLDLFPAANPKLVTKIITKEFDPFSLWRLRIRRDTLATLEPLSFVTVENGQVRSRQERDEYKYFKTFEDWSNGFILLVAIMLEVFKLPALAAAQLRFYQEVVDANETYDFHQSVIKFAIQWHQRARANILDPSAWWPIIPQWRDSFLRQPKPARARHADARPADARPADARPQKSTQICYNNWKPGGCRYHNCERIHVSRESVEKKLGGAGRPQK